MTTARAFDESFLSKESQKFFRELVVVASKVAEEVVMEAIPESTQFSLVIDLQSPTQDPDRNLGIWIEKGLDPSVGFVLIDR